MAAYKFASAKRVVSFGWDESTKYGDAIFTCNFQLEFTDGSIEDVCLRGLASSPSCRRAGRRPAARTYTCASDHLLALGRS